MKRIAFVLAITMTIFAFCVEPIRVTKTSDGIVVLTRFEEYHFDLKHGVLKDFYSLVDGRKHVFTHAGDGFDLLSDKGTLEVVEEPLVSGVGKTKDGFLEEVWLIYNYGIAKKTFIIKNDENYTFTVSVETSVPLKITLPRISFDVTTDRFIENYLVSFNPKTRGLVVVQHGKGLVVDDVVDVLGNWRVNVYLGPAKKVLLKKAFPQDYESLVKTLGNIPGFNRWYDPVFYPLVWFFWWLKGITGSFGWAIILFTVIVRVVLYPLYHAQTKSMIKMRKIQPEIEAIKKKYKDPTKQQEALLKLYKESGINPASGCLMILIQIPIFLLLWSVIRYFVEEFAYGGSFLIWRDLSAGGFRHNWLFILITILASYYTTLLTSQDTRTAWQGIVMSVIFPLLFVSLPSGLFLYYTANTLIQLLVTYYVYKKYKIKGITTRELLGLPRRD